MKFEDMKKLNTPIQYIKGVGPYKSRVLAKLGIKTVSDMLYYLPFRYEDRSNFAVISDLKIGKMATVKGEVRTLGVIRTRSGIDIFQLAVDDGTGVIYGVWFNQPYLKKFFRIGQKLIMYGKVEKYDKLQMNHPQYELLGSGEKDSIHIGRIVPVYHLTQELAQRNLRVISYRIITEYARFIPDILPTKIRARNRLVDIKFAIKNIHFPVNKESLKKAYRRMVFDEFFLLQLAIAIKRKDLKGKPKGIGHIVDRKTAEDFIRNLPFELTESQMRVIKEIEKDMISPRPMNRLVQGEVGSGKTVVAAYALLLTVGNGCQGALMAPTEILAEQHYIRLSKMLAPYGINIILLVQGINQRQKIQLLQQIKDGTADVIIGTHALIQEGVDFKRLGLVVIDEQHKFGVFQRARLLKGEKMPDTLLLTATPIPRTLALTVYGDLDISLIKEIPTGRGEIVTYWISGSHRQKVYNFLKEEIAKGRQAYIVCPRLEETNSSRLKSAKSMYEELTKEVFSNLRVGLIYGKMKREEKESVMRSFKDGNIDILISTIVIEVGIDVPNASVMVVENAERFGLSQLHQLRGRIGRGPYESYCILISDTIAENAKKRLTAMTEVESGFQIAEEDLKLRGPGEIFGTRQHGLPQIRFGDLIRDMEIMELARKEAFFLVDRDPELNSYENRLIRKNLYSRFSNRLGLARIG